MTSHTPALTAEAIAAAASKKTAKVQRQLVAAEAELQIASAALAEALPAGASAKVKAALKHNVAAEEKVHEAAEDLEAVKELLSDASLNEAPAERRILPRPRKKPAAGRSGEGTRSLMPHLRKNVG
ncbi:MAG: hypothetical protein ABI409_20525 [Ramlibacter sp.]